MKAYLQGKFKRLFVNPEKILPEGIDVSKTIDSDIESPNGNKTKNTANNPRHAFRLTTATKQSK